jgi:hypothetical protein
LDENERQQICALGRLGWPLRKRSTETVLSAV